MDVLSLLARLALAVGSALWIARALLGLRIPGAVPRVEELPPGAGPLPSVSIVVAARDERETLAPAARTLLALDHPDLEVVIVDDRSTDGTSEVVDRLAAEDPRVRPVHVTELPDGWLGKVNAMERGWRGARGEWILFTDADVHFAPDTLRRVVAWAERERVDHVSVLPGVEGGSFPLDVAVGGFAWSLAVVQRVWAVRDPRSSAFLGIGAFNLARRAALERAGGFEWLRLEVADDLGLGLMLKRAGEHSAVLGGRGAVSVRWYASLREMAVGLEKNLFATAGRCRLGRIVPRALGLVAVELAPFAALLAGPGWLAAVGAVALACGAAASVLGARWTGRPVLASLLHPAGTVFLAGVWLRAGWLGHRRGGIWWRGTFYPSERLREGLRVRMP